MMSQTWTDSILDEIHRVRDGLAREHDYDVAKLVAYLRQQEKKHGRKVVRRAPDEADASPNP